MKYVGMMLIALALSATGCGVCVAEATRCQGQTAQICDSRGRWQTVMDCDAVQGDSVFSCVEDADGDHTCLPEGGME